MGVAEALLRLGYKGEGGDSEADVDRLERLIGVPLLRDYRDFLLAHGGGYLDAASPCHGPTPFGDAITVTRLNSAAEAIDLLDSEVTPRNMICIGVGHDSMTTCLSIAGLDHGQVFALDVRMRYYWDEETLVSLPHLAATIREFFQLRDADELPERPWGYDNCYPMAGSFSEFLERLRPEGT